MSMQISRSKRIIFSLLMIGFTLGVSFILLEFGLSRYYHSWEGQISYTAFDPTLGWRPRPGTHWVKPGHSFVEHKLDINEYGLRDRHMSESDSRKGGTNGGRIILLGDSFTFATAIHSEDTFPVLLESLFSATDHYEVINAGVPGYGTAQEMLLMKDLAARNVSGDIYIVMIFLNDILDNLRLGDYGTLTRTPAQPGFVLEHDGQLRLAHHPQKEYSTNLVPPKRTRFITLDVIRNRLITFLQTSPGLVSALRNLGFEPTLPRMPSLIYGWYHEEILAEGIPLTKALLKRMQQEADRHHAVLMASLIPSPLQIYPAVYDPILRGTWQNNELVERYIRDPTRPQVMLSEICRDLNIPVLDLYPIFIGSNDQELFIPADGHFSRDGHAIVARHLKRFILENVSKKFLPQSSTAQGSETRGGQS